VFFKWSDHLSDDDGPIGALGVSVTAERSIAVDTSYIPLGLPVWLDKNPPYPLSQLMIAQDVGSAIKGEQRADIFYGSGNEARDKAKRTYGNGRLIVFVPKDALFEPINR